VFGISPAFVQMINIFLPLIKGSPGTVVGNVTVMDAALKAIAKTIKTMTTKKSFFKYTPP
jgi:uncharacterized membrane protein YqgA involved in biofilm formation